MKNSSSDNFYQSLKGFTGFSELTLSKWYTPLPADWFVVITDVRGSTRAIEAGRYKEVNALGVASIVALINTVKPINIPYVFGGDGATLCVPASKQKEVQSALVATRQMAETCFGLQLRIGIVPLHVIRGAGYEVLVGKYQPSSHYQQAMFLGDGLEYAETLVKDPDLGNPYLLSGQHIEPDGSFEGFECRWNQIPSPHGEAVAILVRAFDRAGGSREETYREVSQRILDIYGQEERHHPIGHEYLTMASSMNKLAVEARIKTAFLPIWKRWLYFLKLKVLRLFGIRYMRKKIKTNKTDWGRYKERLIANTDYRKFDELLRMVLAGTAEQQNHLREYLEQLRRKGRIIYGIHSSPNTLITCLIFNYNTDHVHFLDGADGGYTLAAKEMKQQMK